MELLLSTIREAADKPTWSKGVSLAREVKLLKHSGSDEGEIHLSLAIPGQNVSPRVHLWPEDGDWTCDCGGSQDPCEHAIAAVVYIRNQPDWDQQSTIAEETAPADELGAIGYEFFAEAEQLGLRILIISREKKHPIPLSVSLMSLAQGRSTILPRIAPGKIDYTIEDLLRKHAQPHLPKWVMQDALRLLKNQQNLFFEGQPVQIHDEVLSNYIQVSNHGGGVFCRLLLDPQVRRVFRNGAAQSEGFLHPFERGDLNENELTQLRNGIFFGLKEIAALSSEILPALRAKKIRIEILSDRLPDTTRIRPHIEWKCRLVNREKATEWELRRIIDIAVDEGVSIRPMIVYGDPMLGWVEEERLHLVDESEVPVRDLSSEQALKIQLSHEFNWELGQLRVLSGAEAVHMIERLRQKRGHLSGKEWQIFDLQRSEVKVSINPNFSPFESEFPFAFTVEKNPGEKAFADPEKIIKAYKRGESLVPLLSGGFAKLPSDWLKVHAAKLLDILESRDSSGKIPACMMRDVSELCQDSKLANEGSWLQKIHLLKDEPNESRVLASVLRSYQQEGQRWLRRLTSSELGALLADDMGLGKTLQTISVINSNTLVIAPTSVLYNWQNEIKKFRPELSVVVYHGSNRRLKEADVVLTSYALLRLDLESFLNKTWDLVVLDEGQMIKNPSSQAALAAFSLQAKSRIVLSGTPLENSLEDIWSMMRFLNPGLLGSKEHFQEQYLKPILDGDSHKAETLRKRLKPFILRRLKSEVASELPDRIERLLYCEMDTKQSELYQTYRLSAQREIVQKLSQGLSWLQALEALLRLRQIATDPSLVDASATRSPKIDLLITELERCHQAGAKALVFSQWTQFLDRIGARLETESIEFLRIDGSTRDRQTIVDEFQNNPEKKVLLLSLKAAGVGLNLTAAEQVFIMDPWWNPAAEDQAADRAHRIGQDKNVVISKIITKDTVEERILELQEKKRELAQMILAGGTGSAASLSRDDILRLLE